MNSSLAHTVVMLATILLTVSESRTAVAQFRLRTIALTGDTAPGSGGSGAEVPFTSFSVSQINAHGDIAFHATTSPNANGDDTGIFSTVGGALHAVVFAGQAAPGSANGMGDVPFASFVFPRINAQGDLAFYGTTSPNFRSRDTGIFSTVGGTLHAVAFEGQTAPGSGGSGADQSFSSFSALPHITASGEIVFSASTFLNADGRDTGIFSTAGGTLNAVIFEGQTAPGSGGSGADVPFSRIRSSDVNVHGDIAFFSFTDPNVDGDREGMFSIVGGTLKGVAFEGQTAPGSGGSGLDVPFSAFEFGPPPFSSLRIDGSGDIVFAARTSPNVDGGDSGIFNTVGGTLNAVVFEGQTAPGSGGSGTDVPFTGFTHPVNNNIHGDLAFFAFTSPNVDGDDRGIFSMVGGTLNAVIFEGQTAPGSGGSGTDVPFGSLNPRVIPILNAHSDLAFTANTFPNAEGGDRGIFARIGGTLQAVVFEQALLEVAPGDLRVVRSFDLQGFNDNQELAFRATFSDGSQGLFVMTIPEPSTSVLALVGLTFAVWKKRRHPRCSTKVRRMYTK